MSLDDTERRLAALRARAHPLRLRMLSLMTGADMSAAELARELSVSQALASYHLRQLANAELVDLVEQRSTRGGQERRYRYHAALPAAGQARTPVDDAEGQDLFLAALVAELQRRSQLRDPDAVGLTIDAELWVRPQDWERARQAVAAATIRLHERARRPHEPGTVRVSATVAMFAMGDDQAVVPESGGRDPRAAQ